MNSASTGSAPYSDAELAAMMADLESDLVERKESLRGDAPVKIRRAVCAFANDLPDHGRPGVVFVRVHDDGRPTGGDVTDDLLLQLADVKTDGNIVPPPTMTVEARMLAGTRVAVVTAWPSDSPPVRYKGRIWIRVGPRRAHASAQDERILNEKRRHRDPHFDARRAPRAGLSDLSLRRFEEDYLAGGRRCGDAGRQRPEHGRATRRRQDDRLGRRPCADRRRHSRSREAAAGLSSRRVRAVSPGRGDGVRRPRCGLRGLPGCNRGRRAPARRQAHRTQPNVRRFPVRARRDPGFDLPPSLDAVQQLVRNAVMHRTYEDTNAPTHVYWFDDRIEIGSPGGPYGVVNADNFGQPGVVDYRNPILAEAMRVPGLVQRYGFGIPAARRLLHAAGHPEPEFRVDPSWVHCTVRARA